jgi:hypothetical protein
MRIAPISAPYQTTVGVVANRFKAGGTNPLGDAKKVARVLLQLAAMDQPPVRLLLGSEAVAYARAAGKALAESDAQWEELSRSTDRDDATDAERNPLGEKTVVPQSQVERMVLGPIQTNPSFTSAPVDHETKHPSELLRSERHRRSPGRARARRTER